MVPTGATQFFRVTTGARHGPEESNRRGGGEGGHGPIGPEAIIYIYICLLLKSTCHPPGGGPKFFGDENQPPSGQLTSQPAMTENHLTSYCPSDQVRINLRPTGLWRSLDSSLECVAGLVAWIRRWIRTAHTNHTSNQPIGS